MFYSVCVMEREESLVCKISDDLSGLTGVRGLSLEDMGDLTKAVIEVKREEKRGRIQARQEEVVRQNEKLVDGILSGESLSGSARLAGLSVGAAWGRSRSKEVKEMLRAGRREVESLTTISRLDVLNMFLEAIEMARTISDPGQMINGADKIAKMMGYYEPEEVKVDVNVNYDGAMRKIRELSDVELIELAGV